MFTKYLPASLVAVHMLLGKGPLYRSSLSLLLESGLAHWITLVHRTPAKSKVRKTDVCKALILPARNRSASVCQGPS